MIKQRHYLSLRDVEDLWHEMFFAVGVHGNLPESDVGDCQRRRRGTAMIRSICCWAPCLCCGGFERALCGWYPQAGSDILQIKEASHVPASNPWSFRCFALPLAARDKGLSGYILFVFNWRRREKGRPSPSSSGRESSKAIFFTEVSGAKFVVSP